MAVPTELRAYVISVGLFAVLHFSLTIVSNYVAQSVTGVQSYIPWLNVLAYALYVIAGFVAAAIAKRRGIINGVIAGVLAAMTAILLFGVAGGDWFGVMVMTVNGGVLGGIGGAFFLVLSRKKEDAR